MPLPPPLAGLIAAPFTPFHADGSVNLTMIDRLAPALAANGVSGAFVCGTTGEGSSLTIEERCAVAARWASARPASLKLVVHVGHLAQEESKVLARHAASIGADAIAALAPSFFKPASLDALISWCAGVAAAAPQTPFYYYHMPAMTGVDFPMADFITQASRHIPTLAGVKFTHENLMDFSRSVTAAGAGQAVLFGRDEILLGGLAFGARGAVGSTYNYMAPLYTRLIAAFEAGDIAGARELQQQSIKIIAIMVRHGGLAAGKAMMKLIGLDCGPVRPPMTTLTDAQSSALEAELRAGGFFETSSVAP